MIAEKYSGIGARSKNFGVLGYKLGASEQARGAKRELHGDLRQAEGVDSGIYWREKTRFSEKR